MDTIILARITHLQAQIERVKIKVAKMQAANLLFDPESCNSPQYSHTCFEDCEQEMLSIISDLEAYCH